MHPLSISFVYRHRGAHCYNAEWLTLTLLSPEYTHLKRYHRQPND